MLGLNKKPKARRDLLAKAARSTAKGNRRKAAALYKEALEQEGDDPETRAKLARLLAEDKKQKEAWENVVEAVAGFCERGFNDKALAVLRQASEFIPRQVELWERIAEFELQRGRRVDAVTALGEGSRHFRAKKTRHQAVKLLQQAFDIEPWRFAVTVDLARQLARSKRKVDAVALLEQLADRTKKEKLTIVRASLFRISPSPGSAWRWARAALRGS